MAVDEDGRILTPQEARAREIEKAQESMFQINERIKAKYVRIVGPDNNLGSSEALKWVLRSHPDKIVEQVTIPDKNGICLVRIVSKERYREQQAEKAVHEKEKRKSAKLAAPKQLELNWAIDPNDLKGKIGQLKRFLEAGRKVEIMINNRRRQRRATEGEATTLLKVLRDHIFDLGARETKPMEGEILRQSLLYVQMKETQRQPEKPKEAASE